MRPPHALRDRGHKGLPRQETLQMGEDRNDRIRGLAYQFYLSSRTSSHVIELRKQHTSKSGS